MLKNKLFYILLFTFLFLPAALHAQNNDGNPPPDQMEEPPEQHRPNLLRELNLTAEQIKQIRQINQINREKMRETQDRKHEAERLLDEAIYSDAPDENVIRERLQTVAQVQTELIRMRILTEFAVRKILTPEQLMRFRELRQSFLQRRDDAPGDRPNPRDKPRRERLKNNLNKNRSPN